MKKDLEQKNQGSVYIYFWACCDILIFPKTYGGNEWRNISNCGPSGELTKPQWLAKRALSLPVALVGYKRFPLYRWCNQIDTANWIVSTRPYNLKVQCSLATTERFFWGGLGPILEHSQHSAAVYKVLSDNCSGGLPMRVYTSWQDLIERSGSCRVGVGSKGVFLQLWMSTS
jgi:hypothetical protein